MRPILLLFPVALTGCATIENLWPDRSTPPESAPAGQVAEPLPGAQGTADGALDSLAAGAQGADALDTASAQERQDAAQAATEGAELGTTIANLGDPAEPGFWLRTPLVQDEQPGRVTYMGQSAAVTLIPAGGPRTGASRISLPAMRMLGAPLTELVELQVFAG